MVKNAAIAALSLLCVALWVWPRFGLEPTPIAEPPEPESPSIAPELAPLAETLASLQGSPGFQAASVGFCLLGSDLTTPIFTHRAEEAMIPASTLKTVTSATALEILGPDFRFETRLVPSVPWILDPEGRYQGDLVIVGGGDPMLARVDLAHWVRDLKQEGLRQIEGRVIGDARCFPENFTPDAWDWGDVSNYYGAGASGLNLDLNRFTVVFEPAPVLGEPARLLDMSPSLEWIDRLNLTRTVANDEAEWTSIYGGPYSERFTFCGHIPQGKAEVVSKGAIPDPAFFAAQQWVRLLTLEKIEVTGGATTVRRLAADGDPIPSIEAGEPPLLTHRSPPLIAIIRHLHLTSDNLVTECLLQRLIADDPEHSSPVDLITRHWARRGIMLEGLRMEDGSGLARADYIRPLDLARVVATARRGSHGALWESTFNPHHEGRIHWKGGSMSRVRAYTGFTDNGYTFAWMLNQMEADSDTLADWRQRLMENLLELPPVNGIPAKNGGLP